MHVLELTTAYIISVVRKETHRALYNTRVVIKKVAACLHIKSPIAALKTSVTAITLCKKTKQILQSVQRDAGT